MWEDIVLGRIPGTQVQVSFEIWLIITSCIAFLLLGRQLSRSTAVQYLWVIVRIQRVLQTATYTQSLSARSFIQ